MQNSAATAFQPELLSPAGTLKAMRFAFAYGADAVYAGMPRYSLRVRNNEFDLANLAIGIAEAHALGKKFYCVLNSAPHNAKLDTLVEDIAEVVKLQPDAFIVSDPGVIYLMQQHFPQMELHLSVQANTVNWAAVQFWQQQGISRVILSRELALEEIEYIRNTVPGMELEVFVHGALCMAYSGRCLLSGYMDKRDPNQGTCTNACRWPYQVTTATENAVGQFVPAKTATEMQKNGPVDDIILLSDPQKPGELMPAFEDEHGTYIMNSKDLRAVQHVDRLTRAGVHSLKIEGRTKSFYYAARTAQIYRRAIDDAVAGRPFNPALLDELDGLASRGYTEGFLRRHIPISELQNYDKSASTSDKQQFVGEITGPVEGSNRVWVEVKNQFLVGDTLLLMSPQGNQQLCLTELWDKQGLPIQRAPGAGHQVQLQLPGGMSADFVLIIRDLPPSDSQMQGCA
ncbi:tRNA 5-hydroxyuridine modification protein YegQ [Rheinheimera sp. 4Y26]|uniref:prephenate-dependent tRNA uridine(34) hydroxylase TrhP n=1 Tax=Rheinheimera sp. 4Y26 TaxID=2977811 RepID=UPI0021B09F7D|nr:tRNA 5-hydroxyuridine modification protein YegQ [Rheinheimera sp. 4Y26]MCT6698381.1 tRNA 5-hydroxyuridine modification protein YegQ [Rheinheimera sp. 4Y26]